MQSTIIKQVERRSRVATQSEIGGIVCSPHELVHLRACLPTITKMVTPGIRPAGSAVGDQKRIMTPAQAKQAGADYLVIGRPILAAENPSAALDAILEEVQS